MGRYVLNRIISMVISLLLVITITFIILHVIPGGPFTREKALPDAVIKALEARYHLDDPFYVQYIDYLKNIITLDLGPSFQKTGYTVNDLIKAGFPKSAKVGAITVVLVFLIGIPIGVISSVKKNKWQDQLFMFFAALGVTIPNFVLGTLVIYFFGVKLGWIPTFGLKGWQSYIGPVLTLGAFSIAFTSRLMRYSMLEVMQLDYIRTARAKGMPEYKVIGKHALKNALIPVITYFGVLTAAVITGSFVTEKIFAISGMGKMFVESIGNRDYTTVIGATVVYTIILSIMMLVVDIIYSCIDPRIKLDK